MKQVEPEKLDYMHYLPIFFDGLVDKTEPSGRFRSACAQLLYDQ